MLNRINKRVFEDGILLLTVISILLVLWNHHGEYVTYSIYKTPQWLVDRFSPSTFALGAFVFLSGFKLINSNSYIGVSNFLKSRFLRIFPLYYVSIFLYVVLLGNKMSAVKLIIHLLGGQLIFPKIYGNIMPTLWFVGLISFYYFLFLILRIALNSKLKYFVLSGVIYFILLFLNLNPYTTEKIFEPRIWLYLPYFILGVYFGRYHSNLTVYKKFLFVFFILFSIRFIVASIIIFPYYQFEILYHHIYVLPLNILIMLTIIQASLLKKIKGIIIFLSYSSYAAYLFHRPVWYLMKLMYHDYTPFQHIYIILGIPLIFMISYCIQSLYDKKLKEARKLKGSEMHN